MRTRSTTSMEVHPRVGGGAMRGQERTPSTPGPSPRGRGSHPRLGHSSVHAGSIPAWAGEPARPGHRSARQGVHPRVGGGADQTERSRIAFNGPSPRGRGSLRRARAPARSSGSIPAWAGEPRRGRPATDRPQVHPRVGGGAGLRSSSRSTQEGPSPRGRGSLGEGGTGTVMQRSIPAWAGEPRAA